MHKGIEANVRERRVSELRSFQMRDINQLKSLGRMRQFQGDGTMKKMVSCEGISYQFDMSSARNHLTSTFVSLKFRIPLITGQRSGLNKISASTRRDAFITRQMFSRLYREEKRNRTWRLKDTDGRRK